MPCSKVALDAARAYTVTFVWAFSSPERFSRVAMSPIAWTLSSQMIVESQGLGALISGAHLAALTLEDGAVLHTTDETSSPFSGSPLAKFARLALRACEISANPYVWLP